jgi:hypothetical protein
MMAKKWMLALLLGASLIGGVAAAQGMGGAAPDASVPVKGPFMAKFDTNGDGVLEPNERAAMRAAFKAKREAKKAAMLAKYDVNHDGILEPSERKAMIDDRAAKQFAKMDVNNDGTVTLAEFQAFREAHPARHARWGKGRFRRGLGAQGTQGSQGSQQAPATQQAE